MDILPQLILNSVIAWSDLRDGSLGIQSDLWRDEVF